MFLENFKFKGNFRKYQNEVLKEFEKHIKDRKINVVAAPGSGKTILGLQMICKLNENVLILAPTITIRNQWKERFIDNYVEEGRNIDFISEDVYNLNKFNVVTYQALHYALNKKKIKEEQNELEEEETTTRIKTDEIDYNLIQELKNKKIKTIVLDEAHHLRAEWWKSLSEVIDSIEDVKVISLTATPPYDVDEGEWKKYEEICGPIDAEISVPELVATGDLCPHQDYVIFNTVTSKELSEIKTIRNNIDEFIVRLKQNNEFVQMIKKNEVFSQNTIDEELVLNDVEYYSSLIIFLNSLGININKELVKLISGKNGIPRFNKEWAEILLENIIYVHKNEYLQNEKLIKDIKKELEILGCTEKRKVYLQDVRLIKKLMASSISKLDSVDQIVKKEYEALKEDLSMVILADYVRYDFLECNIDDINKIGVVPIFRRLIAKNISNNVAVLTGKLKIVPKSIIPYIKDQLKLINIEDDNIFYDLLIDKNYVIIKGSKKLENAIVNIVTECINLKKINIVIGTVSLLGEGWDAPAVNSLILASYVGSFMLSNQMRGRAIRKSRNQNKTANIWHLASLAKIGNNELDLSDVEALQRRFKGFVGIGYYDDVIQDGMERLDIIDIEKLKKNHNEVNEEMYKIALNRELMSKRWKNILELLGGTNVKMVDKLNGNFALNLKIFMTMDFKKLCISLIITNLILLFIGARLQVSSLMIGKVLINLVIFIYYLIKIIRHLNPVNYIKGISKTILNSMIKSNKLLTNKQLVSSEIEILKVDDNKIYKAYLKGATVYENNLFIKSLEEIYSKVIDTRYIISIQKKNKIKKDTYFNVPSIWSYNKNEAELFLEEWNNNVCKGNLIYTRSKEGRKLLLKARKNSISYNERFFRRKEASNWK